MFNERLREKREELGISQRQFAKKVGISADLYNKYERAVSKPSHKTLVLIANELGTTVDYLLEVDGDSLLTVPKEKPETLKGQKEIRHMEMYRKTAPEIRAAVDKLLETYEWAMKRAEDINNGYKIDEKE